MARGLPVLASTAGGNPEIVPPCDLHLTGDFNALARRICEFDRDRAALAETSLEALSRVEPFLPECLEPGWRAYYRGLAQLAERNEPTLPLPSTYSGRFREPGRNAPRLSISRRPSLSRESPPRPFHRLRLAGHCRSRPIRAWRLWLSRRIRGPTNRPPPRPAGPWLLSLIHI
jgi:hypothetical protein